MGFWPGDGLAEQLKISASDAQVLLRYGKSNGWLDDQPAVITRPYGKGRVTYIGAVLDEVLITAATEWMVKDSGVKPVFGTVPDGVEVSRRRGDNNRDVFVMINFAADTKKITLPQTMKFLLQESRRQSGTSAVWSGGFNRSKIEDRFPRKEIY